MSEKRSTKLILIEFTTTTTTKYHLKIPKADLISEAMSDIFQFVSTICGLIKIIFNQLMAANDKPVHNFPLRALIITIFHVHLLAILKVSK